MNQREIELAMYGARAEDIKESFDRAFTKGIYLMGILSDVQEAMAHDENELARQFLNRAKYLMSEYLPKDEAGRML